MEAPARPDPAPIAPPKPIAAEPAVGSPASKDVGESESINAWPDATAEADFLASAQLSGEPVKPPVAVTAAVEIDATALPSLDEMVPRISAEVRELLDDLFRAKFVAVRRIPKQALESPSSTPG